MGRGVPAGAGSECDPSLPKPGNTSAIAGTSGKSGERCGVLTASATNLPSLMKGSAALVREVLLRLRKAGRTRGSHGGDNCSRDCPR
jgi:hypothetical protein